MKTSIFEAFADDAIDGPAAVAAAVAARAIALVSREANCDRLALRETVA